MSDFLAAPITMNQQLAPPAPSPDAKPLALPFPPLPVELDANTDTARALATARSLLDRGGDRDRIVAALEADGVDPALLDERAPEVRRHDDAHGVSMTVDPAEYWFQIPPHLVGNTAALNSDVRGLTASLGLPGDRGNSFCCQVVDAIKSVSHEPDGPALAASAARDTEATRAAFGAGYDDAAAAINLLLDDVAGPTNPKLIAQLRPGGILCRPFVFAALAARARAVFAWASSRP
jgi:hypothetical protein